MVDIPGDGGIVGDSEAPESVRKGVTGYTDDGELTWQIQVPSSFAEGGYLAVHRHEVDAEGNFLAGADWEEVSATDLTSSFPTESGGTSFEVTIRNVPSSPS